MHIKALFTESREFVIGRVTAASTYITGGVTTASGMAKAATQNGVAPEWFPPITVDTVVLLIGALFTVITGLVSIWAKRQDMKNKRADRILVELAAERARRAWIMEMLNRNGEAKMLELFGPEWRGCDRTGKGTPCSVQPSDEVAEK